MPVALKPEFKGKWVVNFTPFFKRWSMVNSAIPADDDGYAEFEIKHKENFEKNMDGILERIQNKCISATDNEQ